MNKSEKCKLINKTNVRPILLQGHSRHTYHIQPNSTVIADEVDIRGLAMVEKLVSRGVLAVQDVDDSNLSTKSTERTSASAKESKSTKSVADTDASKEKKQASRSKSKN